MTKKKYSSYRWIIMIMAFLVAISMSICQFQVTPYAAEIMASLGLSESQYASIATAPMLVGVFLSFIGGTLGDKIGVKRIVFIGLILTTIGALCRSFAGSFPILLLVTILMGVVGVILTANNVKLMSSWFPPQQLGLAIGIVVAAGNGGTILAMMIGISLGDFKKAFLIGGILFLIITILWAILVREKKTEIPPQMAEMPKVNITDVFKSPGTWIAALGAAFFMAVNMSVSALLNPGLISKGADPGAASFTVIVFSITALIGSIVMPGIIRKFPSTKISGAASALIMSITLYAAWISSAAALRNIFIAICGIAAGGLLPTLMSVPALLPEIGPAKMGAAGGLISTIMMAGAFILPSYVITPIAGGINNMTFILAAVCGVIVAIAFVLLPNASLARN